MAEIERKNAEQITASMHLLDSATNALNSRMYWLAVAAVALAVVQVVVAVVPFLLK